MAKNDFSEMSDRDLRELVRVASNEMEKRGISGVYELHKYDINTSILWEVDNFISNELYDFDRRSCPWRKEEVEESHCRGTYAQKLEHELFDICDLTLGNYEIKWRGRQNSESSIHKNGLVISLGPNLRSQDYADMHKELCDVIKKYLEKRKNKTEED